MSGPSEKAMDAACGAMGQFGLRTDEAAVDVGLRAAHDPSLGLDRSVCLRDVADAFLGDYWMDAHDFLMRKFGGKS